MKQGFKALIRNLLREESGQDMIEYVLVAALIALGSVATMNTLSQDISTAFTNIGTTFNADV